MAGTSTEKDMQKVDPVQLAESDVLERDHVLNVYDAIAPHFSSTRYKPWPRVQAFIESLPKYAMVADMGCGNGKYLVSAQRYRSAPLPCGTDALPVIGDGETEEAYRYVLGVDFSEGLLRLAQQQSWGGEASAASPSTGDLMSHHIPRTDLLRADVRVTALRGGVFDAAISIAVIHHLSTHARRVAAIKELLRLVRPDGLVLISVWAKEQPKKRSRDDSADVLIRWEMHEKHDVEKRVYQRYYHLFSSGELEQIAIEAGGVVRESYYDKENCLMATDGPLQELQEMVSMSVSSEWLQKAADAILTRDGLLLANCVFQAEEGAAAEVSSAAVVAHIEMAVDNLRRVLMGRVELLRTKRNEGRDCAEDAKERQLYVEVLVRVATTGALAQYCLRECANEHDKNGNGCSSSSTANSSGVSREQQQRYFDTLACGLLHVFEAFQEVHSMCRSHYCTQQRGEATMGTVGWDTLLLLHFVHRIPRATREASKHVIDEATGQIVRSWRKLLQSLQAADPNAVPKHSRRRGALAVCNGLLSILFQGFNTHQCRVLINSVAHFEKLADSTNDWSKSILRPAQHMTAEVVHFCYYRGRIMLYDRRFEEAYESLREAYQLLPSPGLGTDVQQRNKQRVRFYLAVSGIVCGKVIPTEIMETDDLIVHVLLPILNAMQVGDPYAFTKAIKAFSILFRKRGVYFILQQAKIFCFLSLHTRTHAALGTCSGVDNTRIPLSVLTAAYTHVVEKGKKTAEAKGDGNASNQKKQKRHRKDDDDDDSSPTTDDQMMCWTAKLIASGLVRGYISYEHKTIVLSRQVPFPTLATPT